MSNPVTSEFPGVKPAKVDDRGVARRLPIGVEVLPDGGVHARVWAPRRSHVDVVIDKDRDQNGIVQNRVVGSLAVSTLSVEGNGYFSGEVSDAAAGSRYWFRLDEGERLYPDPASRFQPEGPHGPSEIVDPRSFQWADGAWRGVGLRGQVIYELHVGTFTREGTWAAATAELPELRALGVTLIEMMPVADFPGRFGWGYDGVDLFAPTHLYGRPDDLRRFVDRAHQLGLGVILDVVYNHFGPDGNYLKEFSAGYFTDRSKNEWGEAIDFDGPGSGPVREFFVANAGYWIDEYHFDGLRLDATQQIFDGSADHILAAVSRRVRETARSRSTFVVAENEPQDVRLVLPPERGGYGLDALWNDDFHHSVRVALTGRNEAYYSDYRGTPQELISAVKHGYLYQGQWYSWQKQRRGTTSIGLERARLVTFIQNHDQVANSASGERLHRLATPGAWRAMTALLLLGPATPMLFQGQEFASSAPFLFFADHNPELARLVREGRAEFLAQFRSLATPEGCAALDDPGASATFERCKLDFGERERHATACRLHKDLLALRRADPVLRLQGDGGVDGAVLSDRAFVLRFFADAAGLKPAPSARPSTRSGRAVEGTRPPAATDPADQAGDRLLIVNLGRDLHLENAPEPLLAPPQDARWRLLWSSEDPRYGGWGTPPVESDEGWRVPGHAAVLLAVVSRQSTVDSPVDGPVDSPQTDSDAD